MGAGKTTVGVLLAERLGWNFLDSDRVVESQAGMMIAEIFARRGESAFREMEVAAIRECIGEERTVLALGGGALENRETRDLLLSRPGCVVVFLEAPLETLIARCGGQAAGPVRPVLADRARLAERWRARLPLYREAHLIVATEGMTPAAVAESVIHQLQDGITGEQGEDDPMSRAKQRGSARGVPA